MKKSLLVIGIVLSLSLVSCGKSENNMNEVLHNKAEETINQTTEERSMIEDKIDTEKTVFNKETLAKYNGKDGMPGYVAVDGIVYDITDVAAWQSPHAVKNLENLKVVGIYEE